MPIRTEEGIAAAAAEAFETSKTQSAQQNVLVALAERRIFRKQGLVIVEDGDEPTESVDNGAIRRSIFEIGSTQANVVTKDDRDNLPIHRFALAGQVLDKYPVPTEDEWDELDPMERAGWKKAESHIWRLVNVAPNSPIQRWARDRLPEGTMFVKTDDVFYVTAEPRWQRSEILVPYTDEKEIEAAAMGEFLASYVNLNPALKSGARSLLKATTRRMSEKADAAFLLKVADSGDDE